MRASRENTIFICAVLGGLGGLACVLQWLGIKPGDLRMTPGWPHWAWLALGLLLFAISIGLSVSSLLGYRRRAKKLAAEKESVKRDCEDQLHRSELVHKDQEYKWNEFYKDYHQKRHELEAQVQALKDTLAARDVAEAERAPFTLSPLQQEAFRCAKELRDWIASTTSLFTPPLIVGESEEERSVRVERAHAAYRARLRFQYESEYRATVQVIYSKFAIENIRDLWIEQFLERVEHNEQVLNMANGLETLAIRQFAPTASQLLQRQLRPLIEGIEL